MSKWKPTGGPPAPFIPARRWRNRSNPKARRRNAREIECGGLENGIHYRLAVAKARAKNRRMRKLAGMIAAWKNDAAVRTPELKKKIDLLSKKMIGGRV